MFFQGLAVLVIVVVAPGACANIEPSTVVAELNRRWNPSAEFALNAFAQIPDFLWARRFSQRKSNTSLLAARCQGEQCARLAGVASSETLEVKFDNSQIEAALSHEVTWHDAKGNPKNVSSITRVKNQGDCGSCYAFSAIAVIESLWAAAGHELTAFSEQSLMDCITASDLEGCVGGNTATLATEIVTQGFKIPMERDYEYFSYDGSASKPCGKKNGVGILKNVYVVGKDDGQSIEDVMAAFVYYYGPMVASVKGTGNEWKYYRRGVLSCAQQPSGIDQLDHGVAIIGYGVDQGEKYWLIKNSWTPLWGENGFVRLQRGTNECGVALATLSFGL